MAAECGCCRLESNLLDPPTESAPLSRRFESRTAQQENIQLDVGSRISVDLKLEVGMASETVKVESTTTPLEAVNSSVSNVVTPTRSGLTAAEP